MAYHHLSSKANRTARKTSSTMNSARFWKNSAFPAVRDILAAATPRGIRFVFRNADREMFYAGQNNRIVCTDKVGPEGARQELE